MSDVSFKDYVLDQLADMSGLSCRRMFGGYGLYSHQVFFAIIYDGRLYLKTDDRSRPAFQKAGMGPFQPNAKQTLKNYYEVPATVLEEAGVLLDWARTASST